MQNLKLMNLIKKLVKMLLSSKEGEGATWTKELSTS